MLSQMRRGRLVLHLPDGSKWVFGEKPGELSGKLPLGIAREAVIEVRRETFFRRCVLAGDIGFGESYVDDDWDSPDPVAVIAWILNNLDTAPTLSGGRGYRGMGWALNLMRFVNRLGWLARHNSRSGARRNISEHYDLSNRFFEELLGPPMMYSAALWAAPEMSLEEAQREKCEALCRSLRLQPSDRVLEIGSGWGGWAAHAASRYGCHVTSITISEAQFSYAWDHVQKMGVSDRVDVQLMDYRDVRQTFDKVVSIEMLEAVGHRYLPRFCHTVSRVLRPGGLLAMQFITCPDSRYDALRRSVDFIQKHIFPGSLLLSLNRVNSELSRSGGFVVHSVQDRGHDYARTLRAWRENLDLREAAISSQGFDETFFRKWRYYLAYCEAAFAMRNISAVQTLHTRPNNLAL